MRERLYAGIALSLQNVMARGYLLIVYTAWRQLGMPSIVVALLRQ
jgi:hypothetical protein